MEIKVINQRKFQLLENHKMIAEVYYPKWWSNNATIQFQGKQFEIKAKGFWQNTFIILKNRHEFGSIQMNWKQDSVISLKTKNNIKKFYHLTQESIWHSEFVLKHGESTMFRIHAKNNWRKFYPDFLLSMEKDHQNEDFHLLIAISIYLINNRLKSAAAGASIAALS